MSSNVQVLVSALSGQKRASWLMDAMDVDARVLRSDASCVTRAELAQALNMLLFADLLERVPEGAAYVADALAQGRSINFDHGALRTVLAECGNLPAGHQAFARILEPLGFHVAGVYPLPRLNMTGHVFAHKDFPAQIAQFFVSELHVDRYSAAFQSAVERIMSTTQDPLTESSKQLLGKLHEYKALNLAESLQLLPNIVACFARVHGAITRQDYETVLNESAEMAWISTEGSVYNHVTDRIDDVYALTEEQRAIGRSIKAQVEVSRNGRVRQTAFKAAIVQRDMLMGNGTVQTFDVPGSFYEFITRDAFYNPEIDRWCLDLTFDASNATGIFKMTDAVQKAA